MKAIIKRHQILFVTWLLIAIWGLINLYSASYIELVSNGMPPYYVVFSQAVLVVLIILLYFFSIKYGYYIYNFVKKSSVLIFVLVVITLFLVPVIGEDRDGAKSVLNLGFYDLQPMEFYKIAIILFFASMLSRKGRPKSIGYVFLVAAIISVGIIAILVEPDLGGALICGVLTVLLILINGEYLDQIFSKYLWIFLGLLSLLAFFLIISGNIYAYQFSRIAVWLNPFSDPSDAGFQMINGLVAISNGGPLGSGFLNSVQKTGFLVQPYTDFIFPIILEEWGSIGFLITLGLILVFSFTSFSVAINSNDRFGELYCYGYGILILTQTMVNIGGTTGTIPMTGVTLPFISMGQNSYLALGVGFIFVVCVDMYNIRKRKEYYEKTSILYR